MTNIEMKPCIYESMWMFYLYWENKRNTINKEDFV